MIDLGIDNYRPPTVFTMGLGSVVVGHGLQNGMPCLYFAAAKKPGLIDSDASAEVTDRLVPPESFILRFANMEAVLAHMERIKNMVVEMETLVKAPTPEPASDA